MESGIITVLASLGTTALVAGVSGTVKRVCHKLLNGLEQKEER